MTNKMKVNDAEQQELIETENENATRALIFQSQDCQEVLVPVPEWKTSVLVRALTGKRRSEYFAFNSQLRKDYADTPDFYERLFFEQARLGCVHPKTKQPIFQPADRDELMGHHNGAIIEMLASIVREISLLNGEVSELAKKKLQSILKHSSTTNSANGSDTSE